MAVSRFARSMTSRWWFYPLVAFAALGVAGMLLLGAMLIPGANAQYTILSDPTTDFSGTEQFANLNFTELGSFDIYLGF